jgi:hypothetical protein
MIAIAGSSTHQITLAARDHPGRSSDVATSYPRALADPLTAMGGLLYDHIDATIHSW